MTSTLKVLELLQIKPQPATFEEYLDGWLKIKDTAKALADMEMKMRRAIFASAFPNPKEGANNLTLPDGRTVSATHKINRSIDESQITTARAEYALLNEKPVAFDELLKTRVELVTSAYRKLGPPENQPFRVVSKMVTSKPGSPDLKVKG